MKLELRIINIKDVQFSKKTSVNNHTLYVNKEELISLIAQDRRLGEIDIELVHPGESCRILQIADVIEPRTKIEGGQDFPGVLGKQGTAGNGITQVLRGAAVMINDQCEVSGYFKDPIGDIVDMSGPGAELTPYSKTENVVLILKPAAGTSTETVEYKIAIKLAGLKAAQYLAQESTGTAPDAIEVFDLPPLTEIPEQMKTLPKIAYIFQAYCTSHPALPGEPILYGDNLKELLPTVVHPNEFLDGAFINPYRGYTVDTYGIQNHPIINELYRRHGKELFFVGVIITTSKYEEPKRERSVAVAANLAKSILGANGVILTHVNAGAPEVDMVQTAQLCEEMGIKSVFITWGQKDGNKIEGSLAFNLPKANAVVNTGDVTQAIALPPVKRIVGKDVTKQIGRPVNGELSRRIIWIKGAAGQLGDTERISVPY